MNGLIWQLTDHFWIKWRHSVLLRQLNRARFRGKIALEVGCGHGLVREMLERDRGIRVDGCDLNQHALEKATSGKGRLLVYNVFDRNVEMLGAYDLLLLMDVIEHIDDDLAFVKASLEHLKPDGLVVINVPAHRPSTVNMMKSPATSAVTVLPISNLFSAKHV